MTTPSGVVCEEKRGLADPDDLAALPEGRILEVDGVRYKSFTLEEWKAFAHLQVDYKTLWDLRLDFESEILSLERELALTEQLLGVMRERVETERRFGESVGNLLDAQVAQNSKRVFRERLTGWIPWALVVVEAALCGYVSIRR